MEFLSLRGLERGTLTPNSLTAGTFCFCPPNSHPLAILEGGASSAPHPAAPVSAGFFHGEALDLPGASAAQSSLSRTLVGSAGLGRRAWHAVFAFRLASHSLGPSSAFPNFAVALCGPRVKHFSLPGRLPSAIVSDSEGSITLIIQIESIDFHSG